MSRLRKLLDWVCFLLCPVGVIMGVLLWASPVQAQPSSNIIANTVQTTSTGANSVNVGCAIGSSTCTGTLNAGVVLANALGAEAGYVEIQSNVPVSTTFRLYNNSGTLMWNGTTLAIGGSISGTTNTIPLFTASNAIGNSIMTQSGTTITVANTLSATTLTGLLSTANQSNVTGVGTITTGTWNATKIGLLYGGTNADLSGTGGTSQFLRQASVGAAITVVRPAVADLSDNSNIFLLNANNSVSATGGQTVSGSVAGNVVGWQVTNTSNGTSAAAVDTVNNDVADQGLFEALSSGYTTIAGWAHSVAILATGTGGLNLATSNASGGMKFYTGATALRWGINSAGDFTFGASSHLADSSGTPTYSSGGGGSATINGTDYAMQVNAGGASTSVTLNFGHTWSNVPVCIVVVANGAAAGSGLATMTTSQVTVSWTNSVAATFNMLCRGF